MQGGGIHSAQLVLMLLLLFVIAFAAVARRLQVPYPIVLVLAGLFLSIVPGIPKVTLDPEVIFFVVLPPLLYAAAWTTSWRDFSYNLVSIGLLAVGLVGFTVLGVAATARWLFGFDWRVGIVLGAVVSPTDAIAATSIARRMGLPRRIVAVLEGESLVNDATGLLALEFGISMLLWGAAPPPGYALLRLIQLIVGGLAVGLILGVIVDWVERRIDDGPIEIAISILVPYVAYLAADAIRASGVLAVVAAGLFLSRRSTHFFSPAVRIQAYAVWNALTFILNGLVFVLIGLQLPTVLAALGEYGLRTLLLSGAALSAVVIVLRLLWVFPGARLAYFIRRRLLGQREKVPPARQVFVAGWAGMRGVIALAAAMSLPHMLPQGEPFPRRQLIIFLTFCVILVTLVLQGLTLPPLIRALGLARSAEPEREETEARRLVAEAALAHLERARAADRPEHAPIYEDLAQHYRQHLASLKTDKRRPGDPAQYQRFRDLSRELARVERETAIRLRDEGRISDEVLRQIERELDLTEAGLEGARRD
jgi:monovalent cation/hydrogen antiporter